MALCYTCVKNISLSTTGLYALNYICLASSGVGLSVYLNFCCGVLLFFHVSF
jgi:hypothetical protein